MTNHTDDVAILRAEIARLRQRVAELEQHHPTPTRASEPDPHEHPLAFWPTFFDDLPFSMQIYRRDGQMLTMNRASEAYWNISRQQASVLFNVLQDEQMQQQGVPALIMRAFNGELVVTPPMRIDTGQVGADEAQSVTNWLVATYFPMQNAAGEIAFVGVTNRDVTTEMAQIEHMRGENRQTRADLQTFFSLSENAPDGILVSDLDGLVTYINPAFRHMSGYGSEDIGRHVYDFYAQPAEELTPITQQAVAGGSWQGKLIYQRKDGTSFEGHLSVFAIQNSEGTPVAVARIVRDLTEQQQAEAERAMLQEQLIAAQQATLRELSTPLIPIADNVVAIPLVGAIDSARAQQVMETLLEGVALHQAEIAIIDITGVQVVDTQVANALIGTSQAARLLGAQVILTGIQPQIAQTLVHLGTDLSGIITYSTLQAGIAHALHQS